MGNTRDALRLIMDQLNDINQAIEFCKTYDDPELWEQLIGYSLAKPGTFIFHFSFCTNHLHGLPILQSS